MKKLQSLKEKLFEKELSINQLRTTVGGVTMTGCNQTGQELWDCSDMDDYNEQQSLSAL
ncbi:hypothetical protein [uncultured Chryseobacterium sp.]|uniref:hypothetical protein n=1 Tax=uncultured Chryseobacterium sp. TaxID=259322 RepID=UPI003749FD12